MLEERRASRNPCNSSWFLSANRWRRPPRVHPELFLLKGGPADSTPWQALAKLPSTSWLCCQVRGRKKPSARKPGGVRLYQRRITRRIVRGTRQILFFPKDDSLGVLRIEPRHVYGCVHVSDSLIVGGETGRGRQGGRSSGRGGGPDS